MQAVDVVGQAGKPRTISGFQTHQTPVRLGHSERAELATEEYMSYSHVLEGCTYQASACHRTSLGVEADPLLPFTVDRCRSAQERGFREGRGSDGHEVKHGTTVDWLDLKSNQGQKPCSLSFYALSNVSRQVGW